MLSLYFALIHRFTAVLDVYICISISVPPINEGNVYLHPPELVNVRSESQREKG